MPTSLSWFRHHYVCHVCNGHWQCERAEAMDDDCPHCRAFDVAPYKSDDWSRIIDSDGDGYVVLECTDVGAHGPDYRPLGRFDSRDAAKAFLAAR